MSAREKIQKPSNQCYAGLTAFLRMKLETHDVSAVDGRDHIPTVEFDRCRDIRSIFGFDGIECTK